MPYHFKEARIQSGKSVGDAAAELGISNATIINWESGRRVPSVDAIEKLADLYGISVDYLLGRSGNSKQFYEISESVSKNMLPFLHECPVYVNGQRWGLVDAINSKICFIDGNELPFSDAVHLSILPPAFQSNALPAGKLLTRAEAECCSLIWVEPISNDELLRHELRGWYSVRERYVVNELGQRFYLDTYGNKWVAFVEE